eukprot:403336254
MRHSQSSQNFYSNGKKVTLHPQVKNDRDSPQKDNYFKSTYSQDFNNPSDKKNSRYKHNQNLNNGGNSMMSLKAVGQSKSRFQAPPETEIYNQILNSPSQIPPAKLLQSRKTQHYYDQHKNQQNKYHSNYQSMTRLSQDKQQLNSSSKKQQSNDPYELKNYHSSQRDKRGSAAKTSHDKKRQSIDNHKLTSAFKNNKNTINSTQKQTEKVSKVIDRAEKQHQYSDIAVPYETGKQRNQLMNSASQYNTHSTGFYNNNSHDQTQSSNNKYLAQFTASSLNHNQSQNTSSQQQPLKGQHRVTDRFVKYPYPNSIITNYRKDFNKSSGLEGSHVKDKEHRKMAFNLEKEHKIINPHDMDMKTTTRVDFQPFSVIPQTGKMVKAPQQNVPFIEGSIYKSQYQNWGESNQLIEKTPQYPVYQLPFKGQSIYQQNFQSSRDGQSGNNSRPESAQVNIMARSSSHLKLGGFQPQKLDYETTKQKDYQPFKITQRPQTSKPNVEAVRTHANPAHFQTLNKREFQAYENYKPPAVDYMPYP